MPEEIKEIKIPEYLTYDQWKKSFPDEEVECESCGGKGKEEVECGACDGTGYVLETCMTCKGTKVSNGKEKSAYIRQFQHDKEKWEKWHRILQEAANAGA